MARARIIFRAQPTKNGVLCLAVWSASFLVLTGAFIHSARRRGTRTTQPTSSNFTCAREVHLAGGAGRKHQSRHLGSTAGGLVGHSDGGLLVFFTSKYPENTALVPWCPAARETHQKRPRTGSTHSAITQVNHPLPLNDAAYAPLATGSDAQLRSRFFACATFHFAKLSSSSTNAAS